MPLIIEDRVKETTTVVGTGPATLLGAMVGFRAFSEFCAVGDTVYAAIVGVEPNGLNTGEWEIGLYTYTAANTLTRTTVHSSSNNDAAVSFTAGTKHVYIDFVAEQIKSLIVTNPDTGIVPFGQSAALYTALKFQDEFDGATLDTTKWDNKLWYEAAPATVNYSVSNGCLNIWPQRDANGVWVNRAITSKFYQIYGYYEIEAQLPTGAGIIPAFWLFSHDLDNEKPTVDVMKSHGASPWQDALRNFQDWQATVYSLTGSEIGHVRSGDSLGLQNLSNGFHKYGVRWEPTGFTFYIDGVQLGAKITTSVYTKRMYQIISLYNGVAGSIAGVPSAANTPEGSTNPMRVNYLRVWQLIDAPAGSDSPTAPTTGGTGNTGGNPIIDYYGDSTIKGWDATIGDGTVVATPAPLAMKNSLGSGYTVNNWGVHGANTAELLAGTDGHSRTWVDQMAFTTATHVIVNNCLNDAKTTTLAAYQANLRTICDNARTRNKVVIFETPNPADAIPLLDSFVTGMKDVATEKTIPVIDQYVMLNNYMAQNGLTVFDLNPDGLHPSQATYTRKGEYAATRFLEIVQGTGGNPQPGGGNSNSGPLGQDASSWEMTFEDHFLGTSLDRTKWNRGVYYEGSTPGTFKVENSNLVMCYQDPFKRGNCTIDTDPNGFDVQGPGFEQTYGFFEARIKLPYGQNVFPAFWLFRHDQREFDVMENFGGSGASWHTDDFHPINAAWTVHRSLSDTGLGTASLHNDWYKVHNGAGQLPGSFPYSWLGVNVIDLSVDYHTYGCEWGAGFIRFFFDGKVMKTASGGGDPFTFRMTEFSGFPMYMMLDFWMEGSGPGSCPKGFGPWEMRVDYVRAWRRR